MENTCITVGQIVRANGLKGEVKVKPLTDDIRRFYKLKAVYIRERPFPVKSVRVTHDSVFLCLGGVTDREGAEALRDEYIQIDRVHAVPLDEDTFYIADILGCEVSLDNGMPIGRVTDVTTAGSTDVFTVHDGKRTVRFPFLKTLAHTVDPSNNRIVLVQSVFESVSIYEDDRGAEHAD